MASAPPLPMNGHRPRWKETKGKLRVDHDRLVQILSSRGDARSSAWLHPSFVCVFLYRVSNHFYRNGHVWLARLVWHMNSLLTGSDVSQYSQLDEGLVIMSPAGTALMGAAGRNLTVMPCAGIGGELMRLEDIGAGPGLPVLGDDVVLEPHVGVLGPVRIGHRVRIRAGVVVTNDVPDDMVIESHAARVLRRRDAP